MRDRIRVGVGASGHRYDAAVRTFRLSPPARRAVRDGLVLAGLLFCGYLFLVTGPADGTRSGSTRTRTGAVDLADPYAKVAGGLGAFTYSPVFAASSPRSGPAPVLAVPVAVGGVPPRDGHLARWALVALAVLAFPAVAVELYHGNIHLLMAAAIALGFRYPASWAFMLLRR